MLVGEGHANAWKYPLGFLYVETSFVVARLDAAEANRSLMMQLAISTILGGSKAQKAFQDQIDYLLSSE